MNVYTVFLSLFATVLFVIGIELVIRRYRSDAKLMDHAQLGVCKKLHGLIGYTNEESILAVIKEIPDAWRVARACGALYSLIERQTQRELDERGSAKPILNRAGILMLHARLKFLSAAIELWIHSYCPDWPVPAVVSLATDYVELGCTLEAITQAG